MLTFLDEAKVFTKYDINSRTYNEGKQKVNRVLCLLATSTVLNVKDETRRQETPTNLFKNNTSRSTTTAMMMMELKITSN